MGGGGVLHLLSSLETAQCILLLALVKLLFLFVLNCPHPQNRGKNIPHLTLGCGEDQMQGVLHKGRTTGLG